MKREKHFVGLYENWHEKKLVLWTAARCRHYYVIVSVLLWEIISYFGEFWLFRMIFIKMCYSFIFCCNFCDLFFFCSSGSSSSTKIVWKQVIFWIQREMRVRAKKINTWDFVFMYKYFICTILFNFIFVFFLYFFLNETYFNARCYFNIVVFVCSSCFCVWLFRLLSRV